MEYSFYAVGWQQPQRGQIVGKVKNFRQAYVDKGLEEFSAQIQFANNNSEHSNSLIKRFKEAAECLGNLKTNGNNTEAPFYREIDFNKPNNETARIKLITSKLNENMNALRNFDGIRFYILIVTDHEMTYRFYIKALRTAKVGRFSLVRVVNGHSKIIDNENNQGKVLPYIVSYAETITNQNQVVQYIFNVQDYEDMFGLNDSKLLIAKEILAKFLGSADVEPEYKVASIYTVKVPNGENLNIYNKLKINRKWVNKLVNYAGEADAYEWHDVKRANEMSENFGQVPFAYDEARKQIILTADTLEAFISVLLNTKKIGVAKNEFEDSLAKKRKVKDSLK